MQQLLVNKQSDLFHIQWTSRVMTIDPQQHVVYISRKGDPSAVAHHKMYVSHIVLWPRYNAGKIVDRFHSVDAILTVRLKGFELPTTHEDIQRVHAHLTATFREEVPRKLEEVDYTKIRKVNWMLRCTSLYALRQLLNALHELRRRSSNGAVEPSLHGDVEVISNYLWRQHGYHELGDLQF